MTDYIATNIGELFDAMLSISRGFKDAKPWWRGHINKDWDLVPSLYRNGYSKKEAHMNNRFRNMAKARHINCPSNENISSWLFLMQHYRLPTRLLDWSESPLVALYFIVESLLDDETDGALWALHPMWLNHKQSGKESICLSHSTDVHKLFYEAFVPAPDHTNPDKRILSVITVQADIRHMVQQSAFTIHGDDTPINKIPESSSFLSRIIIPGKSKMTLRLALDHFGISRSILFPDLENLALELSTCNFSEPNFSPTIVAISADEKKA